MAEGKGTTVAETDEEQRQGFVYHADFDNLISAEVVLNATDSDPTSITEAKSHSDWPKWKEAMDQEMATLEKAGTWCTVPRPSGKNVVGSKWVFHIKHKADGSVDKYKARLVARGFTQVYGVDYFNTYSPVARLTSFRTILAVAARYNWDIESFDFIGAYLNGKLDDCEEIYMQSPPGYDNEPQTVKRLQKSLYGLNKLDESGIKLCTMHLLNSVSRLLMQIRGYFILELKSMFLSLQFMLMTVSSQAVQVN